MIVPPHYLRKNERSSLPTQVSVIEPAYSLIGDTLSLAGVWTFRGQVKNGKLSDPVRTFETDVEKFWTITRMAHNSGRRMLWITIDPQVMLSSIGFWQKIEVGRVELQGWRVYSAPPFILDFRWVGTKDAIRVLGIGNFGVNLQWLRTMTQANLNLSDTAKPTQARATAHSRVRARSVYRFLAEWLATIKSRDLGNFSPTISGQGMNSYRHKFMDARILVHHDAEVESIERKSYMGGRNEVFYSGFVNGPVFQLDFNSLYPSIAKNKQLPYRLVSCGKGDNGKIDREIESGRCVIVGCKISTVSSTYPVKHLGRLKFAYGKFTTYLPHPEYIRAKKQGDIEEATEWASYHCEYLFDGFVKYMDEWRTEEKANGRNEWAKLVKLMTNSTLGKFGARGGKWEKTNAFPADQPFGEVRYYCHHQGRKFPTIIRNHNWQSEKFVADDAGRDAVIAISAFINSYARESLRQAITVAGRMNSFYCDTDSIFCNKAGKENLENAGLVHPTLMGFLKVEDEYESCDFVAQKLYRKGEKIVSSGLPSGSMTKEEGVYVRRKIVADDGTESKSVKYEEKRYVFDSFQPGKVNSNGWISPPLLGV